MSLSGFPWWVAVGTYVLIAYIGLSWLAKHLADQPDQIKRLLTNFAFCTVFAALYALATGHCTVNLFVAGVGVLNGLANMAKWQATKISLSKTSLFAFGDDLIMIALSMTFLGDHQYLNLGGSIGMVLCIAAALMLWLRDRKARESRWFYLYVVAYSGLWGVAMFAIRESAATGAAAGEFVLNWYLGSLATLLVVFAWSRRQRVHREQTVVFSVRDYALVALFALGIAGCLVIQHWSYELAPATRVQPILLAGEAILPAIVGWVVFKEGRSFDRSQWMCAALAIAGTILLGINP